MRMSSTITAFCACCVLVLAGWVTPGYADESNQLTYFTFSSPVELPGVTLPAGTYMFKHPDVSADRHIVQVFSKDGQHIYATVMTISDERAIPSNDPVVTFAETPTGTPEAIKAWFYPGERIGDEFIYPKAQALRIAQATHQPVLSSPSVPQTPATSPSNAQIAAMRSGDVSRMSSNGQAATQSEASAKAAPMRSLDRPKTETPVATSGHASSSTNQRQAATDHQRVRRAQLPATASNLPLFALASLTLISCGIGLRLVRRRLA